MSSLPRRVTATQYEPAVAAIRPLVGLVVFVAEGLQKFVIPQLLGSGRFASIGVACHWRALLRFPLIPVTVFALFPPTGT